MMIEEDPNFREKPDEGPYEINRKYYLDARVPKWDGSFDEYVIENGMGGVYQEKEGAAGEWEVVFEDPN